MVNNSFDAIVSRGRVELRVTGGEKDCEIFIRDSGGGIAKSDRQKIFRKGISLKDSTGLGLAHAERIVAKSGGSIEVDSELRPLDRI